MRELEEHYLDEGNEINTFLFYGLYHHLDEKSIGVSDKAMVIFSSIIRVISNSQEINSE